MSLVTDAQRVPFPRRMNVKLVARRRHVLLGLFGHDAGRSDGAHGGTLRLRLRRFGMGRSRSGSIRDGTARTGRFRGTAGDRQPLRLGSRHGALSWTGWTVDGDFNYDVGMVERHARGRYAHRMVSAGTYGGDCGYWTSTIINNDSYPAEGCGMPGLHNGSDMYFWSGLFDSCPSFNRLQLEHRARVLQCHLGRHERKRRIPYSTAPIAMCTASRRRRTARHMAAIRGSSRDGSISATTRFFPTAAARLSIYSRST